DHPADDVRRPHQAGRPGHAGGQESLRGGRTQDDHPPQREGLRSSGIRPDGAGLRSRFTWRHELSGRRTRTRRTRCGGEAGMTERRGGLGRGLAALIPTGPVEEEGEAPSVPIPEVSEVKPAGSDDSGWFAANGAIDGSPAVSGQVAGAVYREVPVEAIERNPKQPRQVFDEEALAELEHSIREFGLMQPIVVRTLEGDKFELVMGERRLRASQRAGLEYIPAIVRQTTD